MGATPPSPCHACDARCCSAYAIHVTGDDAWRLASGLGVPLHRFLAHAPQAVRSGTGFLLERGGPSHDLLLAGARTAAPRAPCTFLSAGGAGVPRCGVYPLRPRACRRFPAARREAGYSVRDGLVCPPGAWDGHDMARLSWRVALAREAREVETYAAVVAVWNASVERSGAAEGRPVLEYLDFLADAYGWLVRWRGTLRPAERAAAAYLPRARETLESFAPA